MKLFDMREKTFVEALRAFLKEFRLPGEVYNTNKHTYIYINICVCDETPGPPVGFGELRVHARARHRSRVFERVNIRWNMAS